MKNQKQTIFNRNALLFLIATISWGSTTSPALARFYLYPRAGALIPVNGNDVSYSLGIKAGYQWTNFFATELSYSRLIGVGSAPDGDLVSGEGILSYPMQVVIPYISGGAGLVHTSFRGNNDVNSMVLLGTGITFPKILFFSIGAGVTYSIVQEGTDFIAPHIAIGFTF